MGIPDPKLTTWKSKKYLAWIKTQPCAVCGDPSEPHHIKGVGHMSGTGLKCSDLLVIPLCHFHHSEMHSNPDYWQDQWEMTCRTILNAANDGVLKC